MMHSALLLLAAICWPQQPPPAATPAPPPQIEWQRTLADALAVQKESGQPLLVVANMDGETFNDAFARRVYHDPAFIEATRGYVCVLASMDDHGDRDYDEHGERVDCKRFPGLLCSEHKNIEPLLFARFFRGTRNAPRHIGVAADGKFLFDRYLDNSMQTAIDAVVEHASPKRRPPPPQDLDQLLQRRDAAARSAAEDRYRRGDKAQRAALLEALAKAQNEPFDLLRMGLREPDDELFGLAALALSKIGTKDALIDLEDALARVDDAAISAVLVARIGELGQTDKSASRLAAYLGRSRPAPLPQPWSNAPGRAAFDGDDRAGIERELDRCEAALKKENRETTRLELATAQAALAFVIARDGGKGTELWFEDAQRNAARIGNTTLQFEAKALVAITAWQRGDGATAGQAATLALAGTRSDRAPQPWLVRTFLDVLVPITAQTAYARVQQDAEANLIAELRRTDAAFELLAAHGGAAEATALAGIGLYEYAGLRREARLRLDDLLGRFPASAAVHERWRNRRLIDFGAARMRQAYDDWADHAADPGTAMWFAGYGALVAAEQHVKDDHHPAAIVAYGDAVERFAKSAASNADFADSANHFAVLALAGRATLRPASDAAAAVDDLLRAAALRPESLDDSDGLQQKPRAIADRLARALTAAGNTELAAKLKPLLL
ncbi:MAG: hypothetical protein JNN13_06525 [Planctomycetes bacterium]|nr:hypothetical protein [Planctomycetota bacterium]